MGGGKLLLLHWNGRVWTRASAPGPGRDNELTGVTVGSPTDAWAVGNYLAAGHSRTLALHWNGRTWTAVPSPSPGNLSLSTLNTVSVLSGNDAWAVGEYQTRSNSDRTLILHWNGTAWTRS